MYLSPEKKIEFFEKYGESATNTGSSEAQIALYSRIRINHLTEHLKVKQKRFQHPTCFDHPGR